MVDDRYTVVTKKNLEIGLVLCPDASCKLNSQKIQIYLNIKYNKINMTTKLSLRPITSSNYGSENPMKEGEMMKV